MMPCCIMRAQWPNASAPLRWTLDIEMNIPVGYSAYHLSLGFLKIAVLSEVKQNLHYSAVKSKALMTPLRYIITCVPTGLLLCVIFAAFLFTTEHFLVKRIKCLIVDSLTRKQKWVHILNSDLSGMTWAGIWTFVWDFISQKDKST